MYRQPRREPDTMQAHYLNSFSYQFIFAFNLLILLQKYPEKEWKIVDNLPMFIPLHSILLSTSYPMSVSQHSPYPFQWAKTEKNEP